jgi:hypothetical protein
MSDMRIIKVVWLDTCTCDSWSSAEDVKELECIECQTVGYLFEETDKHIKLVSTNTEVGIHIQAIVIPKGSISKVVNLIEE